MHFNIGCKREGIELSKNAARVAHERGLHVYNKNVEEIAFDNKYDVVTLYAILEHVVKPYGILSKLSDIIEDNGLLVVMVPTHECLKEKILFLINKRWHMYSPPEHLNFYSKKFLDLYFGTHGFVLIDRYYTSGGIFNPFMKIPLLNKMFSKFMYYFDKTFFNKFPLFDHMYSYYKKS